MSSRSSAALWAILVLAAVARTAEPIPLVVAHGKVEKADKEAVTFQPRDETGKFGKSVTVKVTGTSKVTVLAPQLRDKKLVLTQKEAEAASLAPGEMIAVIYALPKGQDPVLLSAVVEVAEK